jgi:hypothetical protein
MKCHANRILHDGFARDNRIASRNVAKSNRNQLFTKISKQFNKRTNLRVSSQRP